MTDVQIAVGCMLIMMAVVFTVLFFVARAVKKEEEAYPNRVAPHAVPGTMVQPLLDFIRVEYLRGDRRAEAELLLREWDTAMIYVGLDREKSI